MDTRFAFQFLEGLSNNNNKAWFDSKKADYQKIKKDVEGLAEELLHRLSKAEPRLEGLAPKDCLFRINRDVRFAADKSPYKKNFSVYLSPGGKKSPNAGYYLHLQPGASFFGGGIYEPMPEQLARIRQEIDYNADALKKVIGNAEMKKYFGGGLKGEKLKTAPKGYASDHPDIELLKQKSFIVTRELKDEEVHKKDFAKFLAEGFEAMVPFCRFLDVAMEG